MSDTPNTADAEVMFSFSRSEAEIIFAAICEKLSALQQAQLNPRLDATLRGDIATHGAKLQELAACFAKIL